MRDKIIDKILSGRFIFTIASAVVFIVLSINGKITSEDAEKIIIVIVYAYFNMHRPNGKENGNEKKTNVS